MNLESTEQRLTYLQADVAKLNNDFARLKLVVEQTMESFHINIKNIADNLGLPLLRKRPCDKCIGKGHVELPKPRLTDESGSQLCGSGVNPNPTEPCKACDMLGVVWLPIPKE